MPQKVLFLSSYPPCECATGAFTHSLVAALKSHTALQPAVVAIGPRGMHYGADVIAGFDRSSRLAHITAAEYIDTLDAELLVVAHDYGIYGGEHGMYLLDLLERVRTPCLLCCHSVPAHPVPERADILAAICHLCTGVLVYSRVSKRILAEVYGVPPQKIAVMEHGISPALAKQRERLKAAHGLAGRSVVSSFCLPAQDKGLEHGIEAIAEVARSHSEICYLILGPAYQRVHHSYFFNMKKLVQALGLQRQVYFVEDYVDQQSLLRCIALSDICMAPYLNHDACVSRPLAAAVACGRAIVATPFPYALEALAEGRGILAQMSDADSLARCILSILENPRHRDHMERLAVQQGEKMRWPRLAQQYAALFARAAASPAQVAL